MTIAGLDLSLTSTGIAVIYGNGTIGTHRIQSKGKKGASIAGTAQRIEGIVQSAIGLVADEGRLACTLAVIEAPSYGSTMGSQHERGGLWWSVAIALERMGVPIATVSPQGRAKYATGKGNAGKDEVLAAVIKRYTEADVAGNDIADAVVLAAMGARHLGMPVDDVPMKNLEAMAGAKWPS